MFSDTQRQLAAAVLEACRRRQWRLATAESCTGGLIAACLTEIAGSSDVVDRGFVAYSNRAKQELLQVPGALLAEFGAVSRPVAEAMAAAALQRSAAAAAIAVTGIAGPGGGGPGKPVGLVHLALATGDGHGQHREMRYGDLGRGAVREATVTTALEMLLEAAGARPPA